ncbi:MAG: hypothetical protein ACREN8_09595 [Candidatus Dormibacteraceae bacterium]
MQKIASDRVLNHSRAPRRVWRATDLQRRYRQVLDSATEEPSLVIDGEQAFLVELAEPARARNAILERINQLAQLLAVQEKFEDVQPSEWGALTPFPWIAQLPIDEAQEFQHELLSSLITAARTENITAADGVLAAWKSTAEAYEDPKLLELLISSPPSTRYEVHSPLS